MNNKHTNPLGTVSTPPAGQIIKLHWQSKGFNREFYTNDSTNKSDKILCLITTYTTM